MSDMRQYMNRVNGWEQMDKAVTANQVPIAEPSLPRLRERSQRMRELYAQHAALAATRQAITQEMQQVLEEGDQAFRLVREGIKTHYGKRNEKLVEFGIAPLRAIAEKRRRNKKKSDEAPAEAPAPTPDPVK